MDNREQDYLIEQARLLVSRLERLSADSVWARRASGYRASLLKAIGRVESGNQTGNSLAEVEQTHLKRLLGKGFWILEKAAREYYRNRR